MSSWLRWANNTKQNINLLNAIQRSGLGRLVHYARQLFKVSDKPDKHVESSQSSKSIVNSTNCTPSTCTCATTACRATSTSCGSSSSGCTTSSNSAKRIACHIDGCTCSLCTDYAEYIRTTKGENASARIWTSDEPRFIKQANADSTSSVEYRTGIPTGVTI